MRIYFIVVYVLILAMMAVMLDAGVALHYTLAAGFYMMGLACIPVIVRGGVCDE